MRKSRIESARDKQIERTYYAMCAGIQIDVMDIGKVFAEGHRLLAAGANQAELDIGILTFTQSIAKNGT